MVVERSRGAEILLTNKTVITDADMAKLPDLKFIGVLATGYNIVDIEAASRRRIIVTNIPAYSTMSVAQQIFALLLTITNHSERYAKEVRRGKWTDCQDFSYTDGPITELAGKRFGYLQKSSSISVVFLRICCILIPNHDFFLQFRDFAQKRRRREMTKPFYP